MIERNDPCWCNSGKKWKKCHYPQVPPFDLSEHSTRYQKQYGIRIKTKEQIDKIRFACQVTAHILDELCRHARAGVSTLELDELSQHLHKKNNAIPAPLNYGHPPFPKRFAPLSTKLFVTGFPIVDRSRRAIFSISMFLALWMAFSAIAVGW